MQDCRIASAMASRLRQEQLENGDLVSIFLMHQIEAYF